MTEQQNGVAGEIVRAVPLQPMIETYAGEFAKVLPAHVGADRFQRWSLSMLRKALSPATTEAQQKQLEAWKRVMGSPAGQASVMQALMDCASLGLEPGRTYHLIPYGGEVTGVVDYKGEIELIHRAARTPVVAMLVREGDTFHMLGANIPPRHEPADGDWFGERGPVTGGYAYAELAPGIFSMVVTMSEQDFLHHRDKARSKNVWDEWPEPMRLKTLIHQLRKFVPWSTEVAR